MPVAFLSLVCLQILNSKGWPKEFAKTKKKEEKLLKWNDIEIDESKQK